MYVTVYRSVVELELCNASAVRIVDKLFGCLIVLFELKVETFVRENMSTTDDANVAVVTNEELYRQVKTATDQFFVTIREARDHESQGETNSVSRLRLYEDGQRSCAFVFNMVNVYFYFPKKALLAYEKCLNIIDDIFAVPLVRPADLTFEWTEVNNILQYLKTEK